jgi:heme/copper-type cytochrome/quinol oxidase subunit 2
VSQQRLDPDQAHEEGGKRQSQVNVALRAIVTIVAIVLLALVIFFIYAYSALVDSPPL